MSPDDLVASFFVAWMQHDLARWHRDYDDHFRPLPEADRASVRRRFKEACAHYRAQLASPPAAGERSPLTIPPGNFTEGGIAHRALLSVNTDRPAVHRQWHEHDLARLAIRLDTAEKALALAEHVRDHDGIAKGKTLCEHISGLIRTKRSKIPADRAPPNIGMTPGQQIARNRRLLTASAAIRDFLDSGEPLPELDTIEHYRERLTDREYIASLAYRTHQLALARRPNPEDFATVFALATIRRAGRKGIPLYCSKQDRNELTIEHCQWRDRLTAIEFDLIAHNGTASARALGVTAKRTGPATWLVSQPNPAIDYRSLLRQTALNAFLSELGE